MTGLLDLYARLPETPGAKRCAAEHRLVEVLTFSSARDLEAFLGRRDAEDFARTPIWLRNLAFRLACLQEPANPTLLWNAACDLECHGPGWDGVAELLRRRSHELENNLSGQAETPLLGGPPQYDRLLALCAGLPKKPGADGGEAEHRLLEVLTFSPTRDLETFLAASSMPYVERVPLCFRTLAWRLACLQEPSLAERSDKVTAELTRDVKWCCSVFAYDFTQVWRRGESVLYTWRDDKPQFLLQCRAVGAGAERLLGESRAPLSLLTQEPMSFCPWCGANLIRHYGKQLERLPILGGAS